MTFTRSRHPDASGFPLNTVPWRRLVTLGDSFTEGLWDVVDGRAPTRATQIDPTLVCRGWADRLAEHLAARLDDGEVFEYANLAVRGRLLASVVGEQLDAALEMGADLVTLTGGGNDLLRPIVDPDDLAARIEDAIVRAHAAGADVILATSMDTKGSPLFALTRGRTAVFNAHIWSLARKHDTAVVDLWGMRSLRDWRMWASDRIHLTSEGHRRVAQAALVALGLEPDDADWDEPLPAAPSDTFAERIRTDASWLVDHAYPWATRRATGRSTGEGRRPKRPELSPVQTGVSR